MFFTQTKSINKSQQIIFVLDMLHVIVLSVDADDAKVVDVLPVPANLRQGTAAEMLYILPILDGGYWYSIARVSSFFSFLLL